MEADRNLKDAWGPLNTRPYPAGGTFISNSAAQLNFVYYNSPIGRTESGVAIVPTNGPPVAPFIVHADGEGLTSYSPDGRFRGVLRSVGYSAKMPVDVPKIGALVNYLEIFDGDKLLLTQLLKRDTGDFQTFPSISSGLRWSPDSSAVAWIASRERKAERRSKLGCKIRMFDREDLGEAITGIFETVLVTFRLSDRKLTVVGAPRGHSSCQFTWASSNVIVLQALDISKPRRLGVRSYLNRPFHLFAVKLGGDAGDFKPLLDHSKIYLFPRAFPVDSNTAKVFYTRFIDGFGGHGGPSHAGVFTLDLNSLEVLDPKESSESFGFEDVPHRAFRDAATVVALIEQRSRLVSVSVNLETLEVTELVDIGISSAVVDDVKDGLVLLRISSPVDTPRFAVLEGGELRYLTNSTHFPDVTYEIIRNDNCNDAIIILAPGDKKKFVVSLHGGPCGMSATYFSRFYTFFVLNGYSLCLVNYRGSTGAPAEVQKMLPGRCCEIDVEDVVWHIDRLRATFDVEKLGIWGWSYGGFMATAVAGRCSDKIDFAVAVAPVVNMVSGYYTTDINDWPLVEAGVKIEPDGEVDEDMEVFEKLWRGSPIRFVKGVNVPVLLIHANDDRRVHVQQSYEFFYAMKRAGKPVKLLLYQNGGHSINTPDAWDDAILSAVAFFDDPKGFIENDYVEPEEPEKSGK